MKTTEQRFDANVAPANAAGCHLWAAGTRSGYGSFWASGRKVYAHRYSWELANGPIPAGLCVCHTCDVRACVNPEHLFLGTNADNVADMVAKGRQDDRRGINNTQAKLTEAQAIEVFIAAGPQKTIAAKYGVSQSSVSDIKRRAQWVHATQGLSA